ncbi:uncharacterized protein LOC117788653 [Drosophila innubila]|uniref:uncharacterized protein LOC117788653 n=1 Tax=Drosophila innubila TaxID=198719 RepID=UPI00148DAC8D|nr:uncharacterized protein LOC117788653 [Drosophila innubila]
MFRQRKKPHGIIEGILRELDRDLPLTARCETMTWITTPGSFPIWSRRLSRNMEGAVRQLSQESKWYDYDVEINEHLWSLWGGLHPSATCFEIHLRGRQTLACCVVACCAASSFRNLGEWTPKFLDAIVVNGDKYYRESLMQRQSCDLKLDFGDLSLECDFQDIHFMVQVQLACYGQLYSAPTSNTMGLFEALNYFFTRYKWGILDCQQRYLAFGYSSNRDGGYFLYDCDWDKPIFPDDMGATYVLRVKQLFLLLYCIVVTLNVRQRNVNFQLFSVDINRITGQHGMKKHFN